MLDDDDGDEPPPAPAAAAAPGGTINHTVLRRLLHDMARYSPAQREQLITQVIGNLNEVLETVDGRRDELGQVIDALDIVLTRFDEQDTEILIAADKIDRFAREASGLLARARGDLTPDLRALTVAARGLNLEKEELVAVLQQLPRHYRKLQNAGSYGNFFNFFLCGVRVQTDVVAGAPVLTPWINSDAERCQA